MDELAGKVAVVTGGANGIGFGMAQAFADEGMRIVLADTDIERLEAARTVLTDKGADVLAVPTDVSDATAVQYLRDAAFERFGTAHVLCNNVGIGANGPLVEPIDLSTWHRVLDINFFSALHGIDAFLPRLLEQGEGHIVNTSSRQGLISSPHLGPYPPSKFALVALTEMLHAELAALGTAVSASLLTPGGVLTGQMLQARDSLARGEITNPATKAFLTSRLADSVDPYDVGRLVVRAIRGGHLYINTHRETVDWMRERIDRIAADCDSLGTLR
jgi:NAD(P)-dependent dehydrogenase (short-subunit alcohol dehydrogenase family)